ncbi:uncharacterized protein LOC126739328 [Anthonomus grandis grandis]|uniref:uncharacterized protein LOC126739328 n=1 Tax=Anthonomus grandis grandis TaxID=2921223 RepID=UPI002165B8AA|nr:uncharacterized protein LOC126739328 [Anthonomus grandis grandis]
MYVLVLTLIVILSLSNAHLTWYEVFPGEHYWRNFKEQHNKRYDSIEEENYRFLVFKKNLQIVSDHNELYKKGLVTYHMKINKFGDLTDEEFLNNILLPDIQHEHTLRFNEQNKFLPHDEGDSRLPENVDWRVKKAVTKVKDQKNCAACYAFSSVAALESQHFLKTGHLITLSEQQIIDCTFRKRGFYNRGCNGGNINNTYKYIISNGGIDNDHYYPYIHARHNRCLYLPKAVGATMQHFEKTRQFNETDLKAAVAKIGPVSVMIDAAGIRFYSGGLFNNPKCGKKPNHSLLVVGYGTYSKYDYWLLKNSWGLDWGEDGYILMSRNKGNQCGIASEAYYPLVTNTNN